MYVRCAGVPHGRDLDYLFGHPFFNDTLGNITNIVPEQQEWTIIDRNISDFMQQMWVNFTKYGCVSSCSARLLCLNSVDSL